MLLNFQGHSGIESRTHPEGAQRSDTRSPDHASRRCSDQMKMSKGWGIRFLCIFLSCFGTGGLFLIIYLYVTNGPVFSEGFQVFRFCAYYGLVPFGVLFISSICISVAVALLSILRNNEIPGSACTQYAWWA